jgi:VWFA-related protein
MRPAAASAVFVLSAMAAAGTSPVRALAQGAPTLQNPPTFRAGVNVVELDVSVLDKDRRPMTGLTAADFTVRDNGHVRPVVAFSAVTVPAETPPSAEWMNSTRPDVATNQAIARRIVVLAFCDLLAQKDVQSYETMSRLGHAAISELGPADLTSVVYLYHPELGQPFTVDRAALDQAVERLDTTVLATGPLLYRLYVSALDGLIQLVDSLASVRDRSKVVFFISNGHDAAPLASRDRLYRAAERANASINCLSLSLMVQGSSDFCKEVASNTGGEAVVDTNDPASEVPALFRASQSYYVLGFEPADAGQDEATRRIEVTVDRPNVDVRASRTYEAASSAPATAKAATDVAYASPLPVDSLPLRLSAIPVASSAKGTVAVVVAVTVGEPNVRSDVLQVEVGTQTAAGGDDHGGREIVRWTPRATPTGDREGTFYARVDLPPGYHELRAAVESTALKRTGSVLADVYVPDFAKAPLALSGIAVHTSAPEVTTGTEALGGLLSASPTTRRIFTPAEYVTASLVVFQGGSAAPGAVTLAMTITDEHDQAVFVSSQDLPAAQFAETGRRTESSFELPLARLPPGAYLLTFEATMGKASDRRDVQFTVR